MPRRQPSSARRRLHRAIVVAGGLVALIGSARCSNRSGPVPSQTAPTLRVGIGGIPQLSPQAGLRQIVSNLSLEGLVKEVAKDATCRRPKRAEREAARPWPTPRASLRDRPAATSSRIAVPARRATPRSRSARRGNARLAARTAPLAVLTSDAAIRVAAPTACVSPTAAIAR